MTLKKVFLIVLITFYALLVKSQPDHHWKGTVDNNWNNSANWQEGTVPGTTSYVEIYSNSFDRYPILDANLLIGRLSMQSSTITIGNYTLEATGNIETFWTAIVSSNGKLKTPNLDPFYVTSVYGNITIECEYGRITGGGTFYGDAEIKASPCISCGAYGWPRNSGFYVGYDSQGLNFKGKTKFTVNGIGALNLGTFANTITFDKKVEFSVSNPGQGNTYIFFPQRGGTVNFKDSVDFTINTSRAEVQLRSFVNFDGVVTINNNGGQFATKFWEDHTVYSYMPSASSTRFAGNLFINQSGGTTSLGVQDAAQNRSVLESSASISAGSSGITGGVLNLALTTIHSPDNQIIASTYSHTSPLATTINFDNSTINGKIQAKADHINIKATTFNEKTILNKDGYSISPNSEGGNTFNKPVELINSAGYHWNLGINYPDIFKDSLRIFMSGTGQQQIAGNTIGANFQNRKGFRNTRRGSSKH